MQIHPKELAQVRHDDSREVERAQREEDDGIISRERDMGVSCRRKLCKAEREIFCRGKRGRKRDFGGRKIFMYIHTYIHYV